MKKVLGLLFVLVILLTSAVGTGIAETDETTRAVAVLCRPER